MTSFDARDRGPPPISIASVVSLVVALSPAFVLSVVIAGDPVAGAESAGGTFGILSQTASWLLLGVFLLGPVLGLIGAVRTFRRLGRQPVDDRQRGRALCVVAIVLGALWLGLVLLAFVGGLVALLTGSPG